MKSGVLLISGALFVLSGCVAMNPPPSRDQLSSAYYGEASSTKSVEEFIRQSFGFFDPYSAQISCSPPKKGWVKDPDFQYGWIYICNYNAKNRMGGYVGMKYDGIFVTNNSAKRVPPMAYQWGLRDD